MTIHILALHAALATGDLSELLAAAWSACGAADATITDRGAAEVALGYVFAETRAAQRPTRATKRIAARHEEWLLAALERASDSSPAV